MCLSAESKGPPKLGPRQMSPEPVVSIPTSDRQSFQDSPTSDFSHHCEDIIDPQLVSVELLSQRGPWGAPEVPNRRPGVGEELPPG